MFTQHGKGGENYHVIDDLKLDRSLLIYGWAHECKVFCLDLSFVLEGCVCVSVSVLLGCIYLGESTETIYSSRC